MQSVNQRITQMTFASVLFLCASTSHADIAPPPSFFSLAQEEQNVKIVISQEDDGWAIVQIDPLEYDDLELENLALFDRRTYGGVMLCFYAKQ